MNSVAATAQKDAIADPKAVALTVPPNYRLVWSDEFATNGLPDPTKWASDISRNKLGWHNKEEQYYSKDRAENANVRDGKLVITARREQRSSEPDWGGQKYSSARLMTRELAEWTYGFYEIRAKLPCGKGTWPAIWMLNHQDNWPEGGELDIMEQAGKEPAHVFSTVHTAAGSGMHGTGDGTTVQDACTVFHNYQMHWTPQQVAFGIDGKTHFIYMNPGKGSAAWPFDGPQYLILNIAIGGWIGGTVDNSIFPVSMEVDYVRIYQKAK